MTAQDRLDTKPSPLDIRLGRLTATAEDLAAYRRLLDEDETFRADRIANRERQAFFIETHARLRILLGDALNGAPERLRFHKNPHGKPYLADFPDLQFNLSHTADRMAVAIGKNSRIGIDIETGKSRKNMEGLAEKCFAAEELAFWHGLPETEKLPVFFRLWTRKEAFVKAVGEGIALGLQGCVVDPENPGRMLRVPAGCGPAESWTLIDLGCADGIFGAVAVQGALGPIRLSAL